jgi:hypothetical protein
VVTVDPPLDEKSLAKLNKIVDADHRQPECKALECRRKIIDYRRIQWFFDDRYISTSIVLHRSLINMASLNRDLMKIDGADSTGAVLLSSVLVLGSVLLLVFWAMQAAYL